LPARLIVRTQGAEAKASLKRAIESVVVDAKPSDLPLIRLKSG
jgi:hypothetical protein